MKLTPAQERKLARNKNLHDEEGNQVKPSDLDRDEITPEVKPEVDMQLHTLQKSLDSIMEIASQGEANRQAIVDAVSKIKLPSNPAPIINFKPVIPSDNWKEFESEVVEHFPGGRIKKIIHRRIS
jgi:hypothetical protein